MENKRYHLSHNGSHWCATEAYSLPESVKQRRVKKPRIRPYKDEIFELYRYASKHVIGNKAKRLYRRDLERASLWIHKELEKNHPDDKISFESVLDTVSLIYHMFLGRYKILKRKVNAYDWNWFVTISYDDDKFESEKDFRVKLKRCLNHLVSRRGWCYFGVFERGEEGDRLHFHGVIYIPDGEMVGKIEKVGSYSTKRHKYEFRDENDFFAKTFGVNHFDPVDQGKLHKGYSTFAYLTKYIVKDDEKLVYSRHRPATIRDVEDVELVEIEEGVPFHFCFFGAVYIVANTREMDPFWQYLDDGVPCAS